MFIRDIDINSKKYWNDTYTLKKSTSSIVAYQSLFKIIERYCCVDAISPYCFIDVACGEASGIASIKDSAPLSQCIGLDHSEIILQYNKEKYPKVNFELFDVNSEPIQKLIRPHDLLRYVRTKRLIALSMHSLEHISEYEQHVANFLQWCTYYIICVPYKDYFKDCIEHINYFDENTMNNFGIMNVLVNGNNTNVAEPGIEESIIYILKGKRQ